MTSIHPTAVVDARATLGRDVEVGPFCVIGPDVTVGEGCRLVASVNIAGHTTLGARSVVYPFAALGQPPQSVHYRGGPTRLTIGEDCQIREGVTMSIGTEADRAHTQVGARCFFMANSHVAHDCVVGDNVVFANNAVLGGHVVVGDNCFLGGQAAVRQFCRIGEGAMISGLCGIRGDVIPYGLTYGYPTFLAGLNVVGLKRRGLSKSSLARLHRAYRTLFFGEGVFRTRLERVAAEYGDEPSVVTVLDFIHAGKRGLTQPPRGAASVGAGAEA